MKLSKQERIGVLIIAVILIIGLGIFFFIVPQWEAVGNSLKKLDNKKDEYQAALDKASLKQDLKDQVIAAFEEGQNLADMFFEEMTTYQVDQEVRAFLDSAKAAGHNVVVESLNINNPSTSTLTVSFFEEPEIMYDLKSYATKGQQPSDEELAAQARRDLLRSKLSSSQTVGSASVGFKLITESNEDIIKFIDFINQYEKMEDGKSIRKAVMLTSGLNISFDDVTLKYTEIDAEMTPGIFKDAEAELKKNEGDRAAVSEKENQNADAVQNGEDEDEEDKISIPEILKPYEISLTFYFIERMQDPTELLEEQEAA